MPETFFDEDTLLPELCRLGTLTHAFTCGAVKALPWCLGAFIRLVLRCPSWILLRRMHFASVCFVVVVMTDSLCTGIGQSSERLGD